MSDGTPLPNRSAETPVSGRDYPEDDPEGRRWSEIWRAAVEELNANALVSDLGANRTDYDPEDGTLFIPTDGGDWYLGTGTGWSNLGPVGDITDHTTDTTNPHEVTSDQVGSPSDTEFASHTGDQTNPHSVTATQADALPTSGGTVTGDTTFTNTTHDSVSTDEAHTKQAPFIDVTYFGAAGDGTDDTAAINDACLFAASINAPVYFPPGEYHYTDQIFVDWNGGGVIGYSTMATELVYNGDETAAIFPASETQVYRDFTLSAGSGSHTHGIYTDQNDSPDWNNGLMNSQFQRVLVTDFSGCGMKFGDTWLMSLHRCRVRYCDVGFSFGHERTNDVDLVSCRADNCTNAGLRAGNVKALNVFGGSWENNGAGIQLGWLAANESDVSADAKASSANLYGVYSERNTDAGVHAVDARNSWIHVAHASDDLAMWFEGLARSTVVLNGHYSNATNAVQLGGSDGTASTLHMFGNIQQHGSGGEFDIVSATQCFQQTHWSIIERDDFSGNQSTLNFRIHSSGSTPTNEAIYFDNTDLTWKHTSDGGSTWTNV